MGTIEDQCYLVLIAYLNTCPPRLAEDRSTLGMDIMVARIAEKKPAIADSFVLVITAGMPFARRSMGRRI